MSIAGYAPRCTVYLPTAGARIMAIIAMMMNLHGKEARIVGNVVSGIDVMPGQK